MRDERFVDKLLFLGDKDFYEPIYMSYNPSNDFINIVKRKINEHVLQDIVIVEKSNWWWYISFKNQKLPIQGWKIHIGATLNNAKEILNIASDLLLRKRVAFKFLLDDNILILFNSKGFSRGSSGKFITVYPKNEKEFINILEDLHRRFLNRDFTSPYILSDRRYKNSKILFYRYGGIKRMTMLDILGRKKEIIYDPRGQKVLDERKPYFILPHWVKSPIRQKPTSIKSNKKVVLKNRYTILYAISFSNTGGVYAAIDKKLGKRVIIKEARPYTNFDRYGNDAVSLLKKEFEILSLLKNEEIVPEPVDFLKEWEHYFLVESYLKGRNLRDLVFRRSNPLLKINYSIRDSVISLKIFTSIFKSYASNLKILHENNILYGDASAVNLIIEKNYKVKLIDFEGAQRIGVDLPINLFTLGFRKTSDKKLFIRYNPFDIDYFGMASLMLYYLFPISTYYEINKNLYDFNLREIIEDMGWPTKIYYLIKGLAEGKYDENDTIEILSTPATKISKPQMKSFPIDSRKLEIITEKIKKFILNSMDSNRADRLFPGDPFLYQTNPLSIGFGAVGVLYSLKKSGFELPYQGVEWVKEHLKEITIETYPPGLITGISGIALGLWEIGLKEEAIDLLKLVQKHPLYFKHHSFYYGLAGIGIVNLHFYCYTHDEKYLDQSISILNVLLDLAYDSIDGLYWKDREYGINLGLAYGQSGVALFLLRLSQILLDEKILIHAKRALSYDLSKREKIESNVYSFKDNSNTYEPYIEVGTAGIIKVLLRFGYPKTNDESEILKYMVNDIYRKYSVFPGFSFGLAGFIDTFIDLYIYHKRKIYLEMLQRPLSGLLNFYLINNGEEILTPGDGLLRFSSDYVTGAAGILRVLKRILKQDGADFFLDDVEKCKL